VLALAPFQGSPSANELDLAQLVPAGGRIDAVWYARGEVAVAWHSLDRRPVIGWSDPRRYALTLWTATHVHPGGATWRPKTLVHGSPFPILGRAVRFADVTHDGRPDLLVTILCSECNHGVAAASVFANGQRIYGRGFIGAAKGGRLDPGASGRILTETEWGAKDGDLWFDAPGGPSQSVCCHPYRVQTFLRWTGRRWRMVDRRRTTFRRDTLYATGYP
jgi:hypothetical protein